MSDIKISELPDAMELSGAELIPLVQDGETRKTTADQLPGANGSKIKISDLPDAEPLQGNEVIPLVQNDGNGGLVTRKASVSVLNSAAISDAVKMADIVQSTGTATDKVMSQKAVTDALANKADLINGKVPADQIPTNSAFGITRLLGNPMTGLVHWSDFVGLADSPNLLPHIGSGRALVAVKENVALSVGEWSGVGFYSGYLMGENSFFTGTPSLALQICGHMFACDGSADNLSCGIKSLLWFGSFDVQNECSRNGQGVIWLETTQEDGQAYIRLSYHWPNHEKIQSDYIPLLNYDWSQHNYTLVYDAAASTLSLYYRYEIRVPVASVPLIHLTGVPPCYEAHVSHPLGLALKVIKAGSSTYTPGSEFCYAFFHPFDN